jgi:hypothetical protein
MEWMILRAELGDLVTIDECTTERDRNFSSRPPTALLGSGLSGVTAEVGDTAEGVQRGPSPVAAGELRNCGRRSTLAVIVGKGGFEGGAEERPSREKKPSLLGRAPEQLRSAP